ncbi:MAG: hypothetical protein ACE5JR_01300 [Gemmatimonadota bacterium]
MEPDKAVVVESCPHRERPTRATIAEVRDGDMRRWRVETSYPDGCDRITLVDFRPDKVVHAGGSPVEHRFLLGL